MSVTKTVTTGIHLDVTAEGPDIDEQAILQAVKQSIHKGWALPVGWRLVCIHEVSGRVEGGVLTEEVVDAVPADALNLRGKTLDEIEGLLPVDVLHGQRGLALRPLPADKAECAPKGLRLPKFYARDSVVIYPKPMSDGAVTVDVVTVDSPKVEYGNVVAFVPKGGAVSAWVIAHELNGSLGGREAHLREALEELAQAIESAPGPREHLDGIIAQKWDKVRNALAIAQEVLAETKKEPAP